MDKIRSQYGILFVDDEPSVLAAISRQLHGHFNIQTADSGQAGIEILRHEGPFAVVVSDMRMPEMDGAQFLSKVRAMHPETERILLTGHADVNAAISAVNDGQIFRYLVKPCDRETLVTALQDGVERYERFLATRRMLAENKQLQQIAMEDALLGIPNRRALERDMEHIHGAASRYKRTYSLVVFDIDEFAHYNEFYGSQSGDRVLQVLANHLGFAIRSADHLYRYDEDAFLLVLPETDGPSAEGLVGRLLEEWRGQNNAKAKSYVGEVVVSAGVATYDAESMAGTHWHRVLEEAEAALSRNRLSQ